MRVFFTLLILTLSPCSYCLAQDQNSLSTCSSTSGQVFAKPVDIIRPNYPAAAIAVRAIGDVLVEVTVSPEGKVSETSVQSGHPLLRKVAEIAASQSTFEPINIGCQRVSILIYSFLTGPPEFDYRESNPFHVQIFARTRSVNKLADGKDPCKDSRFLPLGNDAPTLSVTEAQEFPECVEGQLIRLYGVYRVAFENSDYYDPTGKSSAWLSSPYYSITKKCGSQEALHVLKSKNGGTFGLVALGILKTGGSFGHMGGWDAEFQIICVEDAKKFYKDGVVFDYLPPEIQHQILSWYEKQH